MASASGAKASFGGLDRAVVHARQVAQGQVDFHGLSLLTAPGRVILPAAVIRRTERDQNVVPVASWLGPGIESRLFRGS